MCKKIVAILIMILCGILFLEVKAYAAELPSTITLEVGEKYKIKQKGSYGSTAKNIAKVSKKGLVTAKKEGNCKIVFVDSKNNGKIINVYVVAKSESKKTIIIGKEGWNLKNPVFVLEGKEIVLGTITMQDLYDTIQDTGLYIKDADIDSKRIYSYQTNFRLYKKTDDKDIFVCSVKCYPADSKYLKDMIVYGIDSYTQNSENYWFNDMFSVGKAPSYDSFEEEFKKFVSGNIEDNVSIYNIDNEYRVLIKIKGHPGTIIYADNYSTYKLEDVKATATFRYVYDHSNRECTAVYFDISYGFY